MENISDKEVTKKKKRRKRKKSTAAAKTVVKTEVKEEKKFNTAELEVIKEEISENLDNSKQTPQHLFSIKNLFMTVVVTCLLVLVIIAGYLVGLFDSLKQEPTDLDFGAINSIEGSDVTIDVADYEFKVPTGYQVVDADSMLKVNDNVTGFSIEVMELLTEQALYGESTINKFRDELNTNGYTIYASYILDEYEEKFLVFTGVDNVGEEFRIVYSPLSADVVAKFLVTSEYEKLNDDVYGIVDEMLNK